MVNILSDFTNTGHSPSICILFSRQEQPLGNETNRVVLRTTLLVKLREESPDTTGNGARGIWRLWGASLTIMNSATENKLLEVICLQITKRKGEKVR